MARIATLPLFHLYGDPPDDQAFDFVHAETISSRSLVHHWTISPHRHRNLFQILLCERGGGTLDLEADAIRFEAPAVIVLSPTVAHGFRFRPDETEGYVVSFTEDVAGALGENGSAALARLRSIATTPLVSFKRADDVKRLARLCRELLDETSFAREGYEVAARALLGGVYFPIELLPGPIQAVAELLPFTWGLEVMRGALLGAEVERCRAV
jgi:AraC family transcriptional activator of pobA